MSDDGEDKSSFDNVVWATFKQPEEELTLEEMYARLILDFDNSNNQWQEFCQRAIIESHNEALDKVLELVKDKKLYNDIWKLKL